MHRTARWLLSTAPGVAVGLLFVRLPIGFLPDEDQGVAFVQVQTPPGATQGRTQIVLDDRGELFAAPGSGAVESALRGDRLQFRGPRTKPGLVFVRFKDWSARTRADLKVQAVLVARQALQLVPGCRHRSDQSTLDSRPGMGIGARSGIARSCRSWARQADAGARSAREPGKAGSQAGVRSRHGINDNPTYKIGHRP